MRIAVCLLDDDKWGMLSDALNKFKRLDSDKVIIERFNSKEAFALQHAKEPFDIMICCFEGTVGLETIALAKRHNLNVRLIWIGNDRTFSPVGYRIHVVKYIDENQVEKQLEKALYELNTNERIYMRCVSAKNYKLRVC